MLDQSEATEEARADKALADLLAIPVQLRRVREEVGHSAEGDIMTNPTDETQPDIAPLDLQIPTPTELIGTIKKLRAKRDVVVEKYNIELKEIDDMIRDLKKQATKMVGAL